MKTIYFSLIFLIGTTQILAQSPNLAWAKQIGNAGVTDGAVLAVDKAGNSYIGSTYPTSGITIGIITLSGAGSFENSFIAKFDPAGNIKWMKRVTKTGGFQDAVNTEKIMIDTTGNIYFAGYSTPGATINGINISNSTSNDYYLCKLDSNGNVVWIKNAICPDNVFSGDFNAIHLDAQQHVNMVGLFKTTVSLDANHSVTNAINPNGTDAFLVKYDADGTVISAQNLGVINPAWGSAGEELFQFDGHDHLYRYVRPMNSIIKYDTDAAVLRRDSVYASAGQLYITSLAIDPNENILLSGFFNAGPLVFQGNTVPAISGDYDAVIIKLNATAQLQWIYHSPSTLPITTYSKLRVDAIGNIYCIGAEGTSISLERITVQKFHRNGTLIWDESILSTNPPAYNIIGGLLPHNIVQAHNGGNILVMGSFTRYIEFSAAINFTIPVNVYHLFLAQFGLCNTASPHVSSPAEGFCKNDGITLTGSSSPQYLWSNGDTTSSTYITHPGNYFLYAIEGPGCYAVSDTVHVDEYALPDTAISMNGSLTFCAGDSVILSASAGNTYLWNNGSILQNITVNNSGNYNVILQNTNGCKDTSATITVTVNTPPTATINVQEGILSASPSNAMYQWIDCNTKNLIPNANGQQYSPAANGSFAVIVMNNNCTDTSACVSFLQSGMGIYPNPAINEIRIITSENVMAAVIYNEIGEKLITSNSKTINVSQLPPSTYVILVQTDQRVWKTKFVKL